MREIGDAHARHLAGREPVVLDVGEVDAGQRLQDFARHRPLDRDERVARAGIHGHRIADPGDLARNPVEVLDDVRGVHDQHEVLVGQPVGQHIVDERALRGRERRVVRLADGEPGRVVARDVLDGLERVAAGNLDLAHVADVEEARARPHRLMLEDDAGVFDGHVPAAVLDHAGAERPMARVERGLPERAGERLRHSLGRVPARPRQPMPAWRRSNKLNEWSGIRRPGCISSPGRPSGAT